MASAHWRWRSNTVIGIFAIFFIITVYIDIFNNNVLALA